LRESQTLTLADVYRHGRHTYVLRPGDTLTISGDITHGPERLEKVPIHMLSLIIYGNEDD
jgi:hypothetical protein